MNNWIFESADTTFSLCLLENWAEYDDEENISAFFNQDKWSGNLRITSFFWQNEDNGIDKVSEYIQSELNENPDAQLIKLGNFDAAFYSKETKDGSIIYYWVTGIDNHLLLISFNFDKEFLNTNIHIDEMVVVNNILNSIDFLS